MVFPKISHRNMISFVISGKMVFLFSQKTTFSFDGTGLSMNILPVGNKSPVQKGFFTNSPDDLLPTLGLLGRLYNFCNFVILFSLM